MTKSEFRTKHKNIRNNINGDVAKYKSNLIYNYLINMDIIKKAQTIFVYLSYGREVDTSDFVNYLINNDKKVLIPKCDVNSETMIPVVYNYKSELTKNIYGINETKQKDEYKSDIDVIIVPGIAFDKFGNRVGHGKGYYDKFLKNNKICKIALCYSENFAEEEIPHDDNDIPMDYIITDREVVIINH